MAHPNFFALENCLAFLNEKGDPLVEINEVIPWEEFDEFFKEVWGKPDEERKSRAGRKPINWGMMFRLLILSSLYKLSDEQLEFQANDRLSFRRFLGLGLEDRVPDATTIWKYRQALVDAGKMEELFRMFDEYLARQGYAAQGGQILDASIVPVPRNRNTREENAAIKNGEEPQDWADKPAKRSQKDVDARWVKKNGENHYGYKNHVNIDRKHKLVRRYHVSDAAQHDSQAVDHLLMDDNTGSGVWADAAYRSEEIEGKLHKRNLKSHIHRKGKRGKPLSKQAKRSNLTNSRVRARVEHVFGAQVNDMGGVLVRTIGIARARVKIGMKNLVYNMRRYCQLLRLNSCPA